MTSSDLRRALVRILVEQALAEDRAHEDVTTSALVPEAQSGRATIIAKAEGILAGIATAEAAFAAIDPSLGWQPAMRDGDHLSPGNCVAGIEGTLASILRAERVALNFLSHLSGVATAAGAVVRALEGTGCKLRDTRKTTPGLRALEKYAVWVGGGTKHRMDLSDGVLIKDNHIAALRERALGVAAAVRLARETNPAMRIEIEVTNLEEAREALEANADELLLDNMSLQDMRDVVALTAGRSILEASGGITLGNALEVAETGVDYISMGAITHSAPALDMSLEIVSA